LAIKMFNNIMHHFYSSTHKNDNMNSP
jgi:hypothetical protein